jgi:hypothetical protein
MPTFLTTIKNGTMIDAPRFRGVHHAYDVEALNVSETEKAWIYPTRAWRLLRHGSAAN